MARKLVAFALLISGCSGVSLGLSGLGPDGVDAGPPSLGPSSSATDACVPTPAFDGGDAPDAGDAPAPVATGGGSSAGEGDAGTVAVPPLDASSPEDADGARTDAGRGGPEDAASDSMAGRPDAMDDGGVDAAASQDGGGDASGIATDAGFAADATIPSPLIVFLTLGVYDGNLGGVLGADSICQNEASTSGILGLFKAWISDATSSAATRLTHSASGYQLLTGAMVAGSWDELVTSGPRVAIDVTNPGFTNGLAQTAYAWTGTAADGTSLTAPSGSVSTDCDGWRSADGPYGFEGRAGYSLALQGWTAPLAPPFACSSAFRLYCMQQ